MLTHRESEALMVATWLLKTRAAIRHALEPPQKSVGYFTGREPSKRSRHDLPPGFGHLHTCAARLIHPSGRFGAAGVGATLS